MNEYSTAKQKIRIMYLDDEPGDIHNFKKNAELQAGFFNISLRTSVDFEQVISWFEEERYPCDVLMCDHNMPRRSGFSLMRYLQELRPEVLYVLYTGEANLDEELKSACRSNEIVYFTKAESYATLPERITNKIGLKKAKVPDRFYIFVAQAVVQDLRNVAAVDKDFAVYINDKRYTPEDIIQAIHQQLPIGYHYMENYVRGMQFFETKQL